MTNLSEPITPDSKFRITWDLWTMSLIFYELVMIPMRIAFEIEDPVISVIDTIVDIIFILDIALNFNTGFYSKGLLVMNRKRIVANYLKLWFWLDLLASIPYSWFISDTGGDSTAKKSAEII